MSADGGVTTVRAAVLRQMGLPAPYTRSRPLVIEDLSLAPPRPGEVRVRIRAAGLCHSDLSVIDGSRPRVLPMVLGHEASGTVLSCGPGVEGLAPGDLVVFSFMPSCGHCTPCASGRAALCEPGAVANGSGQLLTGGRRWSHAGTELHHHLGVSAFAAEVVASARSLVKVPGTLDPAIAALFGCAVLTGVGAVVNTAQAQLGESVAIVGLGGVGLAALLGARACGAHPLVAVDSVAAKRALALELGATHVLDPAHGDALAQLRQLCGGGAQLVVECAGNEAALSFAYNATRRGGTTVTAGLPDPAARFSIPAVSLVAEERTIKGSYMGSAVPARDIPRFVALYQAGRLPVDRLLTHRLALDDINAGFDRLARGEAVRQVVVFD